MGRNINPGIPRDTREWPINERLPYPKWLGKGKDGIGIIAQNEIEERALREEHELGQNPAPASAPVDDDPNVDSTPTKRKR